MPPSAAPPSPVRPRPRLSRDPGLRRPCGAPAAILLLAAALALSACAPRTPPAAVASPGPAAQGGFAAQAGDSVLFAVDESALSPAAQATLRQQAQWLLANGSATALIEGHADEQGTRDYNLALGARRASAVRDFLVAEGVAPGRLDTVTYGKERPIEICSDEACYAQNRRAVTVLRGAGGA